MADRCYNCRKRFAPLDEKHTVNDEWGLGPGRSGWWGFFSGTCELCERCYEKYAELYLGKSKKISANRESLLSPKLRFEILKRDNFTCQYCGKKGPEVVLEVDHIKPYKATKNNSPGNLITACKECNRGKRAKEII